jgi:hypothetical protein
MSEEVASANGLLIELARVRSDRDLLAAALHQVEAALAATRADAATLRQTALAYVTSATYEERERLRAELYVLATVEHPGVLLLKELTLLRELVADVARWRESIDARDLQYVFETMDKIDAMKAGGE